MILNNREVDAFKKSDIHTYLLKGFYPDKDTAFCEEYWYVSRYEDWNTARAKLLFAYLYENHLVASLTKNASLWWRILPPDLKDFFKVFEMRFSLIGYWWNHNSNGRNYVSISEALPFLAPLSMYYSWNDNSPASCYTDLGVQVRSVVDDLMTRFRSCTLAGDFSLDEWVSLTRRICRQDDVVHGEFDRHMVRDWVIWRCQSEYGFPIGSYL